MTSGGNVSIDNMNVISTGLCSLWAVKVKVNATIYLFNH